MNEAVQNESEASIASVENVAGQPLLREFFLGFIKIHILHHAAQEPVYGLQLIEELRRHGYHLSPGTLYPLLHGLERSGYLVREEQLAGGKVRKYYRATFFGNETLRAVRAKIEELVTEVLRKPGITPPMRDVVETGGTANDDSQGSARRRPSPYRA